MKIKELYKTVNQIGRWIHKPLIVIRLSAPDRDDAVELSIDEIIEKINTIEGDYWVMIKGSKTYTPSDEPQINELINALHENKYFVMLFQDALKSTKHINNIDYLELFLREVTQENIYKAAENHEKAGDIILYFKGRSVDEIRTQAALDYPANLGFLCCLPEESCNYIQRAMDMNRTAYLLPSSRWQTTVRMYTIMKDGGYFPEVRKRLIKLFLGDDSAGELYDRYVNLLEAGEK